MAKKKAVPEHHLSLPPPPGAQDVVDTHTHLASTYAAYRSKYPDGLYKDVFEFVRAMYKDRGVKAIVDVWCEAPVQKVWKELADSALDEKDRQRLWGGLDYWFVMGVHPHEAKMYDDEIEREILQAMEHPRCVGWGEMGLDYHYDNSPRETQQEVFTRQLRHAVRLGKPLTIHTREAEDDTERILKAEVPQDHKIHIHCFTDSPEFGQRLLEHFPNLYIGITGVITFSTNKDTPALVKRMGGSSPLRILLETDAPFMVPSTIYNSLFTLKGRLPLSHSAMIPWTAEFVANLLGGEWTTDAVLSIARANARSTYNV
ncbi:hypothetical protein FISHEDRAFT_72293 [Fistulina hepatica ATCC 64428]|uniref:Metallo-dependent hydrolase n=1 Tax=Fistulina hepatica ATCC 64428 TaxID=1128425 RepID=A0A0D7AFN9_9AGAR|nr:hypothetical protein FISHEDRAFT_72293 [Fistulina hepatica ATCC 64428]